MSSSSSSTVRYLDVMTCRASHTRAGAGTSTSLLSSPLYLSDMSHIDVQLESLGSAGTDSAFYPTGGKSVNIRQKLDDAVWQRVNSPKPERKRTLDEEPGKSRPQTRHTPGWAPKPESPQKRLNEHSFVGDHQKIRSERIASMKFPAKPKPPLAYSKKMNAESAELLRTTRSNENKLLSLHK